MRGVGEGGFSGMMPLLRSMSFLGGIESQYGWWYGGSVFYHSVSALGSSTGTWMGMSGIFAGFILMVFVLCYAVLYCGTLRFNVRN